MENKEYHISFFKPTTEQAKRNRNLVILLLIIWVIAIYGFHFFMKGIEKEVSEPALITYQGVVDKVYSGNATGEEKKEFLSSVLAVFGKPLSAKEDSILSNTISSMVFSNLSENDVTEIIGNLKSISTKDAEISVLKAEKGELKIRDKEKKEEIQAKIDGIQKEINADYDASISTLLSYSDKLLPATDTFAMLKLNIAPWALVTNKNVKIANKEGVTPIMEKYLTHYRSFLTDTKFLGFPFHYFYTAVFLLILFVGLCWFYCVKIDGMNKKLGIED